MPEGHTIHRLARDHARDFGGGQVLAVSSPQGRAAETAAALDGGRLEAAEGFGKHLLHRWSTGDTLHVHLGLYGRFRRQATPAAPPTGLKRLRIEGDTWTTDLSGPIACELFDEAAEDRLLARLGPDPLRSDADPERFFAALRRRRIPIGAALLDQAVIAGIGNVYRAEILHMLRISPLRAANTLTPAEATAVWELTRTLLTAGVKANRIVTTAAVAGRRRRRGESVHVYRRATCATCAGPIEATELAARTIWSCPACQPR